MRKVGRRHISIFSFSMLGNEDINIKILPKSVAEINLPSMEKERNTTVCCNKKFGSLIENYLAGSYRTLLLPLWKKTKGKEKCKMEKWRGKLTLNLYY